MKSDSWGDSRGFSEEMFSELRFEDLDVSQAGEVEGVGEGVPGRGSSTDESPELEGTVHSQKLKECSVATSQACCRGR